MASPNRAHITARTPVTSSLSATLHRSQAPPLRFSGAVGSPTVLDAAATRRSSLGLVAAAAAFLLLVAFSTNLSAGFWTVRAAVLLLIGAVGLPLTVVLVRGRTPVRPAAKAALAFLGWAALSTALAEHPALTVLGRFNQGTGLLFVAALVGCWALGAVLPESGRVALEWGVIVGVLVNCAVAV